MVVKRGSTVDGEEKVRANEVDQRRETKGWCMAGEEDEKGTHPS